MSRVLVTGAGGFIGRHTLLPLLAAGHDVHAVTSRALSGGQPTAVTPAEEARCAAASEVHWHSVDLLAPDSAGALMRGLRPTHLLHLAWYTEPGAFWGSLENLDWVQASLRMLRAFGEMGGQRAVLAGTCTEYAWERETHCVEESGRVERQVDGSTELAARALTATPVRPATLYGAAKHSVHGLAERWAAQVGVELSWGRVFYVYGPHEHPARLVSGVARALLRGEEVPCTHGMQVRDYLYSPELGGAFAALLGSAVTGPVNMASGEPMRLADIVAAIAAAAGGSELVRLGALPQRAGEPERLTADIGRLRDEVGWHPSLDVHEGITCTVEWWRRSLDRTEAGGTASSQLSNSVSDTSRHSRHVPGRVARERGRATRGTASGWPRDRRSGPSAPPR